MSAKPRHRKTYSVFLVTFPWITNALSEFPSVPAHLPPTFLARGQCIVTRGVTRPSSHIKHDQACDSIHAGQCHCSILLHCSLLAACLSLNFPACTTPARCSHDTHCYNTGRGLNLMTQSTPTSVNMSHELVTWTWENWRAKEGIITFRIWRAMVAIYVFFVRLLFPCILVRYFTRH